MTSMVLVHGAWNGAWCWAAVQAELDRLGVPSWAVDLPGHGTSPEPLADLHTDARCVAELIERLGDEVVLVGHSYGGAVISQVAQWSDSIAHMVYVAAFVLAPGDSMRRIAALEGVAEEPPSLLGEARRRDGHLLHLDPIAAVPALYGHSPVAVQQAATARLGPQPVATFTQEIVGGPDNGTGTGGPAAARRATPSTYVRSSDDRCVPLSHQDAMAAGCDTVLTLNSDHCPMLSVPVELAAILDAVVASVASGG